MHHEQFNLVAGHKLDKVHNEEHNTDQILSKTNTTTYYKHSVALQVMLSIFGPNVPKCSKVLYHKILECRNGLQLN